jgi:hypothetical protein
MLILQPAIVSQDSTGLLIDSVFLRAIRRLPDCRASLVVLPVLPGAAGRVKAGYRSSPLLELHSSLHGSGP